MSERKSYTYVIARYTHDPISSEFINVGVVLLDMSTNQLHLKFREAYSRAKAMFPTLDRSNFVTMIKRAARAIKSKAPRVSNDLFSASQMAGQSLSAEHLVLSALPRDDHGIQVGAVGNGTSRDMEKTLDDIFARFVLKHTDKKERYRRDDNDVWRPVLNRFKTENVADLFAPSQVTAKSDVQKFSHTWRNGVLHCIQPLSFDLSDADAIREKARSWLGRLSALDDVANEFKAYLVIGAPTNANLMPAYQQGLELLAKVPKKVSCELVYESKSEEWATGFAQTMRDHVGDPEHA
jgi:Protein of unknown function (DUF3037)